MFSPIVAIASVMRVGNRLAGRRIGRSGDRLRPNRRCRAATSATPRTRSWKASLRATKSVSELTSMTTALVPALAMPIRPSAAVRPDFLSALAMPLARSQSIAASMSPLVSARAFLQSIMPAPVFSRSSFTIAAVIVLIFLPLRLFGWRAAGKPARYRRMWQGMTRECDMRDERLIATIGIVTTSAVRMVRCKRPRPSLLSVVNGLVLNRSRGAAVRPRRPALSGFGGFFERRLDRQLGGGAEIDGRTQPC